MGTDPPTYDCPGCHEPIRIENPVTARDVDCPTCGSHWAVETLDVPGNRFWLRLTRRAS